MSLDFKKNAIIFSMCLLLLCGCSTKDYHNFTIPTPKHNILLFKPSLLKEKSTDTTFHLYSVCIQDTYLAPDSNLQFVVSYTIHNTEPKYDFNYYFDARETPPKQPKAGVTVRVNKGLINGIIYGHYYLYHRKEGVISEQYFTKVGDCLFYFTLNSFNNALDSLSQKKLSDSIINSIRIVPSE